MALYSFLKPPTVPTWYKPTQRRQATHVCQCELLVQFHFYTFCNDKKKQYILENAFIAFYLDPLAQGALPCSEFLSPI